MNATNTMFRRIIVETRNLFNASQSNNGFFARRYRRITPPSWMKNDHRFIELYEKQDDLFSKGRIVWGAIIQANTLLFESGKFDCPAAIIYSLDERIDERPDVLLDAATDLFSLKGTQTDPELQQFADKLADEMVADWILPIPTKLTSAIQCYYTTTMIIRKHLPLQYLSSNLFPFLICPGKTLAGMIVPSKFWDEQLTTMWRAGH